MMNMIGKILSSLVAFIFMGSNIHTSDVAHFTKVGNYNICDVNCENNKHFVSHDNCDLCNKNIRDDFVITKNKSLRNDYYSLFFSHRIIISSGNSNFIFNTRAPPSNIS